MRIACISDTHCTIPEVSSGSLFPRQLAALGNEEGGALYERMRNEIWLSFLACIAWFRQNGPWDFLVHLGDVTGGFREQGCFYPSARKLAESVKNTLGQVSPVVRFVIGNHDPGYSHKGSLPGSGINLSSVETCREVFGDLFWRENHADGLLSVGLCSPIAEYQGDIPELLRYQREQASFLGDTLSGHREPWILYAHNPCAVKYFSFQIGKKTTNLHRLIYGDFHDPRKESLLKALSQIPGASLAFGSTVADCLRKGILCPSAAPLWWQGHGLLAITATAEKIRAKQRILIPPQVQKTPISSFWRCLWWMIRPKKAVS